MRSPVDEALWTVRPAFGVAGGPDEHALTEAGLALAFTVGSGVRRGAPSAAIQALAAGGGGALAVRNGSRMTATDLGRFDQLAWGYLKAQGMVEADGSDAVRLTARGRASIEAGKQEQERLLRRVREAHPIATTREHAMSELDAVWLQGDEAALFCACGRRIADCDGSRTGCRKRRRR